MGVSVHVVVFVVDDELFAMVAARRAWAANMHVVCALSVFREERFSILVRPSVVCDMGRQNAAPRVGGAGDWLIAAAFQGGDGERVMDYLHVRIWLSWCGGFVCPWE